MMATIRKKHFTYDYYIEKKKLKLFEPEMLKFTWKFSYIAQNQVYQNHGTRRSGGEKIGETIFTCVSKWKVFKNLAKNH
jgi:hypothetical protein